MKIIEYIGFRFFVILFKICPFGVIYFFSDILYFLLYYIFQYRKKVVFDNLKKSFPNKSDAEIKKIMKKYFHHLSDITLESIKSMSISEKELKKRYVIENSYIADKYFDNNQSIICLTSHYGNWEYGILATNNAIKHQAIALYLPLSNKLSEKYGLKKRCRFGMKLAAVQETRTIFENALKIPSAIIMAADQSPSNREKAIWVNFLNHDTACIHGPEAYAKKTGMPILYLKLNKPSRGKYILQFEELITDPAVEETGKITEKYFKRLEKDIIEKPEYWLWSHRRWKMNRC